MANKKIPEAPCPRCQCPSTLIAFDGVPPVRTFVWTCRTCLQSFSTFEEHGRVAKAEVATT